MRTAVSSGLNVENGLHEFLRDDEELSALAARHGVELRDLRRPPADLNVPTGANLEQPTRNVLTVGSDCAIGKMTVSLELDRAASARGLASRFVPTGQTGIAIAGWGIAVDAVVSDFIAGAAERLVVEGHERGGELLFVEGQGAVTHPAYSGVTLGLIHGSAPHAFVLCHQAGTTEVEGYPGHPLLPLPELVELHEWISLPARKARVAAIALNTRDLSEDAARAAMARAEAETGRHGGRSGALRRRPAPRRCPCIALESERAHRSPQGCARDRAAAARRVARAPRRRLDRPVRRRPCADARRARRDPESPPSSPSRFHLTANTCSCIMANTCSDAFSCSRRSAIFLWAAFARSSDASGPERHYVVQPYDTLWSIAASGYNDPRQGVWEIRERNGLRGATIVPGQVLVLP